MIFIGLKDTMQQQRQEGGQRYNIHNFSPFIFAEPLRSISFVLAPQPRNTRSMSNLTLTADRLRLKIEKLLHLHKKLEEDHAKLLSEKEALREKIREQEAAILQLEEHNKVIRLAQQLPGTAGNTDLKLKINELVREIDKCIAQLNN
jgi:hypothetical protein